MGVCCKLFFLALIGGAAFTWHSLTKAPPPAVKLQSVWWGPGKPVKQDETIRPFTIKVSDAALADLAKRLDLHKPTTPSLETTGFEYGFNSAYLTQVVDFWRKDYKWRERETFLNAFPQFKTRVQGLDLHYIHVKPKNVPKGVRVLPLLMLHGWPGSVREFYEVIPLMTTPRKGVDFVFEVVVPSLAGYGFSEGASKPGLGAAEMSVLMFNLVERVGFTKFYIQGGDWGSAVASNMAIYYPENVLGIHLNMGLSQSLLSKVKTFIGSFFPSFVVDDEHAHLMYPFTEKFFRILEESGYMHIQSTKPDTVGVALKDSPVGLAAYILEKFSTWTNPEWRHLPDGGLTKKYTLTNLLDNIMIYWVTDSITTSMRLYSETMSLKQQGLNLDNAPVPVPTAIAAFPHELLYQSPYILADRYPKLVRFTHMARGGHFAAFEEPRLLADDVWDAVGTFEDGRGKGKDEL